MSCSVGIEPERRRLISELVWGTDGAWAHAGSVLREEEPVFNRRKPDDRTSDKPQPTPLPLRPAPTAAQPAASAPPETSRPAKPLIGLGGSTFIPAPPKEPAMARIPFSTPPAPQPQGSGISPLSMPPGPGSAPAPRPGMNPGMNPGMGGPGMGAMNSTSAARQPVERRTLVVGRGISVQGTVTEAERLVVEGTVEASMIHATELSIALGGVFRGEVEVEDAEIAGIIDGTLLARGSLVVRATGKVLGTARCRRLQVEDGGQITGRIEMLPNDELKSASAEISRPATPPPVTPPASSPTQS